MLVYWSVDLVNMIIELLHWSFKLIEIKSAVRLVGQNGQLTQLHANRLHTLERLFVCLVGTPKQTNHSALEEYHP